MEESKSTYKQVNQFFTLESVLTSAFKNGLPVALWRLPNTSTYHLIVGLHLKQLKRPNLEELSKGFIISPFLISSTQTIQYIPADFHFEFSAENTEKITLNKSALLSGNITEKEDFLNRLNTEQTTEQYFYKNELNAGSISQSKFIKIVNEAIKKLALNEFKKVVLSRFKKEPYKKGFSLINSFLQLSEKYSHAFISLTSSAETGTWLGATPETLVEVKGGVFRTMALAGTQRRNKHEDLREITWKQKEIEEQALVSRYIINCFKKIRLREFDEIGPRTTEAASLVHLQTDFIVNLKETNFPELGSVMLELLHPTSAVCGMPKDQALEFIVKHEGYNRQLYSGYLGPVNVDNSTNLFVNLRCVQFTDDSVVYYAGAGITIDSEAEKEWEETAMKMGTVAACL